MWLDDIHDPQMLLKLIRKVFIKQQNQRLYFYLMFHADLNDLVRLRLVLALAKKTLCKCSFGKFVRTSLELDVIHRKLLEHDVYRSVVPNSGPLWSLFYQKQTDTLSQWNQLLYFWGENRTFLQWPWRASNKQQFSSAKTVTQTQVPQRTNKSHNATAKMTAHILLILEIIKATLFKSHCSKHCQ